jgi:glycosyltransferase involved in cell wall biosynthesis
VTEEVKKLGFYLTSTGFGGLEMNAVNLARWMKERGWDVHFFTTRNSRIHRMAEEAGLNCPYVNRPNKYFDMRNAWVLASILRKAGIQNLIIFDNHDLSTANFCKKFFFSGLHMIYLQQMQFKVKKTSPAHTFRFSGLDYWISPLESLKKQVLRTTRVPENKIKVIPLCLETGRFLNNPIKREEARMTLKLPKRRKMIGVLGRIAPTKGQLGVISAFRKLTDKYPDVDLLIMGEPTINEAQCIAYEKECHQMVENCGIQNRVHFRPFRPDVELFFAATDIFIMPSKKETFGMVTVEAMLSGIPVIGTNSGGTPELLEHGDLGQLFTFGRDEELIKRIENLLTEKFNFKEIVEKARTTASDRYDHKRMCEGIEALLK